jgi:hypothetical protein
MCRVVLVTGLCVTDRYDLNRLKLISEDMLTSRIDASSVATITSGKHAFGPGWFRASVPVAQPGLTNRDWSPIFSPGCYTNRD